MKTPPRPLLTSLLLPLLLACSSPAPSPRTYLLFTPTQPSATQPATIRITHFPTHLTQSGIALIEPPHQLHISTLHRWAQPLDQALLQALAADLNGALTTPLTLHIDQFAASTTGQVHLIGHYTPEHTHTPQHNSPTPFNLTQPIPADGFPAAIAAQRALITQLARHIQQNLPPPPPSSP